MDAVTLHKEEYSDEMVIPLGVELSMTTFPDDVRMLWWIRNPPANDEESPERHYSIRSHLTSIGRSSGMRLSHSETFYDHRQNVSLEWADFTLCPITGRFCVLVDGGIEVLDFGSAA